MTILPDDLYIFPVLALAVPPFAVHDGGIHVGRREGVGFIQQRDHTQQNGPEGTNMSHSVMPKAQLKIIILYSLFR